MRKLKREIWPYEIILQKAETIPDARNIDKWCNETLGYRFRDWYSYSIHGDNRIFAFRDEAVLLVFKLKWGNYAIRENV